MERSIVHHNHAPLVQNWEKLAGKPKLKQGTIHCAIILKGCKNFSVHLSRNDSAPLVFAATDPAEYFLASGGIAVFPVQVRIDPALIHIGNLF